MTTPPDREPRISPLAWGVIAALTGLAVLVFVTFMVAGA